MPTPKLPIGSGMHRAKRNRKPVRPPVNYLTYEEFTALPVAAQAAAATEEPDVLRRKYLRFRKVTCVSKSRILHPKSKISTGGAS